MLCVINYSHKLYHKELLTSGKHVGVHIFVGMEASSKARVVSNYPFLSVKIGTFACLTSIRM